MYGCYTSFNIFLDGTFKIGILLNFVLVITFVWALSDVYKTIFLI